MIKILKKAITKSLRKAGYKIIKVPKPDSIIESDETFQRIYKETQEYTMTSKLRMYALYKAVVYIVKNEIPGDFVECGVWRGGSTMLIAHTLLDLGDTSRKIYLYDTFEGMAEPTESDFTLTDQTLASERWSKDQTEEHNEWCYASLPEVKENMSSTKYPDSNMVFVKGKVEDTIPGTIPEKISLLRLDTDWYESTKHELKHMYPLLEKSGVLILDDYGRWAGAKKAVDEYFPKGRILLNTIDHSGRIGIKFK